jgi:hypothetical protein
MAPLFEKRRQVLKAIDKFWPVALLNSPSVGPHAQHPKDQAALAYLEDLWVVRDPAETRVFTLEFVSFHCPLSLFREVWTFGTDTARVVALQGEPVLL